MTEIKQNDLAGIQYYGLAGVTSQCVDAIKRLIHYGDTIHEAKLLTCRSDGSTYHALILLINYGEKIAVKSGFASGYTGTGAHGFARALQLLIRHNVKINEYEVAEDLIDRLDSSCLLASDLEQLESGKSLRPERYRDYIVDLYANNLPNLYDNEVLYNEFPASIPYGLIDVRIIDLVLDFFQDPDARLMTAYRRLENLVKERTGIKGENGQKLFSKAFQSKESVLYWDDEDQREHASKANMFSAIYGTYRNPRAHKEAQLKEKDCLRELLLINELYLLEGKAIKRPPS
jgi:hypothetical protein